MIFGRKSKPTRADTAEIELAIAKSKESATQSHEVRASLEEQRPWVESVVTYLEGRRQRNGFGEDFTIAMTPHRKRT
jgi:hypothetical protein